MLKNQPKLRINRSVGRMLILIAVSVISTSAYGQAEKINLKNRNISIGEAVVEISRQAGYRFAMSSDALDRSRVVNFSGTQLSLKEALDQITAGSGYSYIIKNKYIVMVESRDKQETLTAVYQPDRSLLYDGGLSLEQIRAGEYHAENYFLCFRQGKSLLENDYMTNVQVLANMREILSDKGRIEQMAYITIIGSASPEGNSSLNQKLAIERAANVKSWIMWQFPDFDRNTILTYSIGEDWLGLANLVREDKNVPSYDEVLAIVESDKAKSEKEAELKKLGNGTAYQYLKTNIYPFLRGGAACGVYFYKQEEIIKPVVEMIQPVEPEPAVEEVGEVQPLNEEPIQPQMTANRIAKEGPDFALKTNLIYLAGLMPNFKYYTPLANIEAEWYFAKRWSLAGTYEYSKWDAVSDGYFAVSGGSIEPRFWFRNDGLFTGFYAGIYGAVGEFNIRDNSDFENGQSGSYYGGGLSVGYFVSFSKRWGVDIGLRGGYRSSDFKYYTDDSQTLWLDRSATKNHFGITGIRASLSYRF